MIRSKFDLFYKIRVNDTNRDKVREHLINIGLFYLFEPEPDSDENCIGYTIGKGCFGALYTETGFSDVKSPEITAEEAFKLRTKQSQGITFRLKENEDKDFPVMVQVVKNGIFSGISQFCKTGFEAMQFIKNYNK